LSHESATSLRGTGKTPGDQRGFVDLFWKGVLLVEQKSAVRNLVDKESSRIEGPTGGASSA